MRTAATFLLALSITASAQSQTPEKPSGPSRNMPNQTIEEFSKELRDALVKQDAVALAFLVNFPLGVTEDHGSITIVDPAALKAHFNDVFTPAVRQTTLKAIDKGDYFVNDFGLHYGWGVLHARKTSRGVYAIYAVNNSTAYPVPAPPDHSKLEYVCTTNTHRIAVERTSTGVLRYRSWRLPRPATSTPDLTILNGKEHFEGTGVCAYPIYTFKNANTVYQLHGAIGCTADSGSLIPKDATGSIAIKIGDKKPIETYCF